MSTNQNCNTEINLLAKLEQVSVYEFVSWYEATLLSNQSSLPDIRPLSPLNSVLRRSYSTICEVAYLRKCLQEGKALLWRVYITPAGVIDIDGRESNQRRAIGVGRFNHSLNVNVWLNHNYMHVYNKTIMFTLLLLFSVQMPA